MHMSKLSYQVQIYVGYGWVMSHDTPFSSRERAEKFYLQEITDFPASKFRLVTCHTIETVISTNEDWPEEDYAF